MSDRQSAGDSAAQTGRRRWLSAIGRRLSPLLQPDRDLDVARALEAARDLKQLRKDVSAQGAALAAVQDMVRRNIETVRALDRRLIRLAGATLGVKRFGLLHPSLMYHLFLPV